LLKTSPNPKTASTPTSNVTANWKTYINSDYDYSIKYPPDWTFGEHPTILEGQKMPYSNLPKYTIFITSQNIVLDSFEKIALSTGTSCVGKCPEEGSETSVKLGTDYRMELPTVEKRISESGFEYYYVRSYYKSITVVIPIPGNEKVYIEMRPESWPQDEGYLIFDQILSTFKFIDLFETPMKEDGDQSNTNCSKDEDCEDTGTICTGGFPGVCYTGKCIDGTCKSVKIE
jgi:hypothetical protein